jgi:hypothetical protein
MDVFILYTNIFKDLFFIYFIHLGLTLLLLDEEYGTQRVEIDYKYMLFLYY